MLVVPKLVWLISVPTGRRSEFLLHCVDRKSGVIGATPPKPATGRHLLASPYGTANATHEYFEDELGNVAFLPAHLPCHIAQLRQIVKSG